MKITVIETHRRWRLGAVGCVLAMACGLVFLVVGWRIAVPALVLGVGAQLLFGTRH